MTQARHIMAHIGVWWSMLWRATLLFPVCMLATVLVIVLGMGRFFFPLLAALGISIEDWSTAAIFSAAWIFAMLVWRWKRFQAILDDPPSIP